MSEIWSLVNYCLYTNFMTIDIDDLYLTDSILYMWLVLLPPFTQLFLNRYLNPPICLPACLLVCMFVCLSSHPPINPLTPIYMCTCFEHIYVYTTSTYTYMYLYAYLNMSVCVSWKLLAVISISNVNITTSVLPKTTGIKYPLSYIRVWVGVRKITKTQTSALNISLSNSC